MCAGLDGPSADYREDTVEDTGRHEEDLTTFGDYPFYPTVEEHQLRQENERLRNENAGLRRSRGRDAGG